MGSVSHLNHPNRLKMKHLLVLGVLSLVSYTFGAWHIDAHTSSQDVSVGDDITLMCRSSKGALDVTGNANWKTCMWKREEDSSFCLMEYKCVKHCNDPFSHRGLGGGHKLRGQLERCHLLWLGPECRKPHLRHCSAKRRPGR